MSDKVETAEATPAPQPSTYKEYLSMKAEPAKDAVVEKTEETEAESAPAEVTETPKPEAKTEKKQLTPEQRSERDRERTERRFQKLTRELEETKRELAATRNKPAESAPAKPASDTKPKLGDYVKEIGEGKKYATYEEAEEAYQDARDDWRDVQAQAKADQRADQSRRQQDTASAMKEFNGRIKAFTKDNPDFVEARELVTEAIEDALGDRNHVSTAIVRCEHPGEVIQYLHDHPATLEGLLGLTPALALLKVGAISSKFDSSEESPKPKTEEPEETKPPRTVRGRGDVPNLQQAVLKATDFKSYREAARAARKANVRF